MKSAVKYLFAAALPAMALLGASGCSVIGGSDVIYDISPIVPYIYVYDEDGDNLLDPSSDNALNTEAISVTFKGEKYSIEAESKAYLPYFFGLKLSKDMYGNMMLMFGELDGTEDFDNEDLTIVWGDGSSDVITIFNHFRWKSDGSPSITRRFYVNGVQTDSEVAQFLFTLKPQPL